MKKQVKLLAIALFVVANSLMAKDTTVIPDKLEMIFVEGSTFTMSDGSDGDNPAYSIILSNYSIGKHPIAIGHTRNFANLQRDPCLRKHQPGDSRISIRC